mgnify:CR=1 FL=1
MSNFNKIIQIAQETIQIEQEAIANLVNLIDEEFAQAVDYIYNSKGRVVISGIGKMFRASPRNISASNVCAAKFLPIFL